MEQAEKSGTQLHLMFLDWAKAFDRVRHDKLLEALARMGSPVQWCNLIQAMFTNPEFEGHEKEGESNGHSA